MTGLLVAHAGAGATWQALLTVVSVGLLVLFVMALAGKLALTTPGDLTLPLAAVAVLASLAPVAGDVISDMAPWAVPAGAVILVALFVAAASDRPLAWRSPLALGTVALAVVAALALGPTLASAWYPDGFDSATTTTAG